MDEEVAVSTQLSGRHLADADSAEPSALLCKPAPTRVIPGHYHRFDAHDVTVTERKKRETKRHRWIFSEFYQLKTSAVIL